MGVYIVKINSHLKTIYGHEIAGPCTHTHVWKVRLLSGTRALRLTAPLARLFIKEYRHKSFFAAFFSFYRTLLQYPQIPCGTRNLGCLLQIHCDATLLHNRREEFPEWHAPGTCRSFTAPSCRTFKAPVVRGISGLAHASCRTLGEDWHLSPLSNAPVVDLPHIQLWPIYRTFPNAPRCSSVT